MKKLLPNINKLTGEPPKKNKLVNLLSNGITLPSPNKNDRDYEMKKGFSDMYNTMMPLVNPIGGKGLSTVASGASKVLPAIGKYFTTKTPLKNAYKLNPKALKENPETFLYRVRPVGQNIDMNMSAQFKAKEAAGESLTWYQKNLTKPQTSPQMLAREKYYGKWFDNNPSRLDFYINPNTRNFADNDALEILRKKLPKKDAVRLNVSNFDDAKTISASHNTEFILPKQMIDSAEKFPEKLWKKLIEKDKQFNTPNWIKGYKPINK
jgi:hypothetical protein